MTDGPGFQIWIPGPEPYRRQPDVQIQLRSGATVGLPKGAVWRSKIFPNVYPNEKTTDSMAQWRNAWLALDRRPYVAGPISAAFEVRRARPASHLRADGYTLTPAGLEQEHYPTTAPDLDNVEKAALDALKRLAFDDDSYVVALLVTRTWAPHVSEAGVLLTVRAMHPAAPALQLPLL